MYTWRAVSCRILWKHQALVIWLKIDPLNPHSLTIMFHGRVSCDKHLRSGLTVLCKSVSCPVERVKLIGSASEVLNSVILLVTKVFSLYSDRDRCHSGPNIPIDNNWLTCKAHAVLRLMEKMWASGNGGNGKRKRKAETENWSGNRKRKSWNWEMVVNISGANGTFCMRMRDLFGAKKWHCQRLSA